MKCSDKWLRNQTKEIFKQEYKSWYKKGENIHRGHIPYTVFRATEKRVLALLDEREKEIREKLVVTTLEHTHPHPEFWKGWNKVIKEILGE